MSRFGTTLLRAGFTDIEQLCADVRAWNLDFKPLSPARVAGNVADLVQMRFGDVDFNYARFRTAIDQAGEPPAGRHSFTILSPETKYIWWRGHDVGPDDVLVFHSGVEYASVSGEDFETFILSVAEDHLQSLVHREGIKLPPPHRRPEVFRPPQALLAEARGILSAARHPQGGVTNAIIQDLSEQFIVAWLAHSGFTSGFRAETRKERALTAGLEFVHANPREQLSVSALCNVAGVSRRTLETAFLDQFGIGPAAFVRHRRLASANRALKTSDPLTARVGDIMEHFGFTHVGQFAADYRKMFGERPSETLAANGRG